jgi:tetratricopeptide (TPR) repeat protein
MQPHKLFTLFCLVLLSSSVFAQNAKKHFKAGEDFIFMENYVDAIDQFTKAIELDPDFDKAYIARADAYEKVGKLKEAALDYDRASTFLDKTEIFYAAGRLYYELGEYETAIERIDVALELKRTNMEAYHMLSKTYLAQGKYNEALEECNAALGLKENSENFYLRGTINDKLGNLEFAEEDYEKSIRRDDENIDALIAVADVRIRLGKLEEAMFRVNQALKLDQNCRQAYYVRSKIYVKQLDYPSAINDISKNLLMDQNDEEMYFVRGCYYQEFTQHPNAINDFTKVIMLNPGNPQAYFKRAFSYEQIGDFKSAIKDYEALLPMSEHDEQAKLLIQEAGLRLFELYRETNKPVIVILDPAPRNEETLQFPTGSNIASIKGQIEDESGLKTIFIDQLQILFQKSEDSEAYEFLAAIEIGNKESITISATDVYDNTVNIQYGIMLTEVDAPGVVIIAPYASDDGQIYLDSNDPTVYVEGRIEDESLIESIRINDMIASYIPDELNPSFSANINIMNKNKINVVVSDVFGNETAAEFTLNREAALISENNPMGKTWAIFIENSDYETFASLEGPTKDITLMKSSLAKYQVHNFIHKKDMSKSDIERFFSIELRDLVRSNRVNSLLIWYAGHGKFVNETGYWIPTDAKRDDEFTYFNINALKASLQSYSSSVTHTLVITDACESGPSFYQAMRSENKIKSCDDWQATRFKSSQVFSSAGYELAVDNSQFTRTFANSLANNPDACIPIESIVNKVTSAVVGNNQQKPQFGKIAGLEDEDGTFFFISKEY